MLLIRRAFNYQLSHPTKSSCLRETSQLSYFPPTQISFLKLFVLKQLSDFPPSLVSKTEIETLKPMPYHQVCWSCCYRQLHWCHFGGGSRLVLWGFSTEIFVFFSKEIFRFFSKGSFRFFKSNFQVFQKKHFDFSKVMFRFLKRYVWVFKSDF